MELKAGDVLDGRYKILGQLGAGGFSRVYLGKDGILEREVAIKFASRTNFNPMVDTHKLNAEVELEDPNEIIIHEAKVTAKFTHSNILPIYDLGEHDGINYLVTAVAASGSLRDIIGNFRETSLKTTLDILQQLASVIDYLHQIGILHRDIKPENVLMSSEKQLYLIDFGLTQASDEILDRVGEAIGSIAYLAPEVIVGKPASNVSDIYAFGIIAFECFTGLHPFDTNSIPQLISAIQENPIPSVSDFRPELPTGVDVVLNRLCAKNPEDRYQTASEAVDDLYRVFYSGQGNIEGKVFISYATKDKDYVHKLAAELRSVGVDIWIDQDIKQGSDWGDSIENALKACDLMLLIATEASMDSAYVNHEWSYFMGLGKPVYPFVPDTKLPENIHPRLNRLQLVQGTGDMLADIQNVVTVLAGGNPKKLGGLDE